MIGTDQVDQRARAGDPVDGAGGGLRGRRSQPTEFVTALARQDQGNYDAFAVGWSGRIDPDGNIYQFVHSKGSLNNLGWSNPRMDLLLDNARKATTAKARTTLYRAAFRILRSQLPLIYLYHPVNRTASTRTSAACEIFGDGLIRADCARSTCAESDDDVGGFILRKVGAALIVVFLASVLVFVGVRAIPGDPALAFAAESSATRSCWPTIRREVRARRAAAGAVRALDRPRAPGRPRTRLARAAGRAHDRHPAADHARARGALDPDRRAARDHGRGRSPPCAAASLPTTRRRRSRCSGCRCRTSGSAC